ncbi:MAG: response regulator, partial [Gammaproteobacteria bacterium]|nr:response regulator [Gammaproteobacteria bacterium]
VAKDARTALRVAYHFRPQLAIIDYNLPGDNGDQLTRDLLADPLQEGVLIVIHTERNGVEQVSLESGAVDVLYKEDPQPLFILRIRSLCRFIEVHRQSRERERELERLKQERAQHHAQKMASIGVLASGIAHEFNNLLQPILGFSDLLLGQTDPQSRDYERLTLVRQSAARGAELVRQILDFSRKDANLPDQPIALFPLVKSVLKMVQATLPDPIHLEQQIDPSLEGVRIGATELCQVLLNLCSNSLQAIGEGGGEIKVVVTALLGSCRLEVHDNGDGMEPSIMEQAFDPFFTTREVGQGSGMGLALVLAIVERCKGTIKIESQRGVGSVVTLTLPMEPLQRGAEVIPLAVPQGGREQRILLVDDAPAVVAVGQEMLEQAGYQVETALSGQDALHRYRQSPHDLVVSDFSMPGMNGVELGGEIQALGHKTPLILLTGVELSTSESRLRESGIQTVLHKPVVQCH